MPKPGSRSRLQRAGADAARERTARELTQVERKVAGDAALQARFRPLLMLSQRVLTQEQRRRGRKVYALHASEVECITLSAAQNA